MLLSEVIRNFIQKESEVFVTVLVIRVSQQFSFLEEKT